MIKSCLSLLLLFFLVSGHSIISASQDDTGGFAFPQYSQKVSLDFKNADLKDVLKVFSKQIGANFILSKDVSASGITVYLDNVPVEEALNQVLSANGLAYEFNDSMNLFIVKVKEESQEKTATRVYALKYASVDSSKMKISGSSGEGGLKTALQTVLTSKGKVVDNPRTNSVIITDIESNFPEIEKMIARIDIPLKQVIIEVEMLDVSKSTSDKLGAKFNLQADYKAGTRTDYFPFDTPNVVNKYAGTAPTFTSGTLNLAGVTLALNFLKSQGDTKSLARPRIITNDNETATIQISTNEAIGLRDTSSTNNSITTKEAERYQTGVFLTVTPQVNGLTNEISMVVEPKVIDASGKSTFDGVDFANPEERSVKVNLRVQNGKTVVIGGLLRRASSDSRTSVPFLGKLPLIGAAFRSSDKTSSDRELMVFLTPYVVDSEQPMPSDLKSSINRQIETREQTAPDMRSGVIDSEMDKLNTFRNGH